MHTRLPISFSLLENILLEVKCLTNSQPYLQVLYLAVFSIAYYGLLRIVDVADGPHAIKTVNVEIAGNKDKIRILLITSKMHGEESRPQEIKILAREPTGKKNRFFCPFKLLRNYMKVHGNYMADNEKFLFTEMEHH